MKIASRVAWPSASVGATKARTTRKIVMPRSAIAENSLLEGIAKATNQLLTASDRHLGIDLALATLGCAVRAERGYIFENSLHPVTGESVISLRWEWVAPGIAPQIDNPEFENFPYSPNSWWYEFLSIGQTISGRIRDLPLVEIGMFSTKNTDSIIAIPLIIDAGFWGFIGFQNCLGDRQISTKENLILTAAASSIGNAIARQQAETKVTKLETQIQEQTFHLKTLNNRLCKKICQRQQIQDRFCYGFCYDRLTEVPNRTLFIELLKQAIDRTKNLPDYLFAVLFLDIDRLKIVNETLGHPSGDSLLVAIANRLKNCLRENDIIARIGGDEFAILLDNASDDIKNVNKVVERIKQELSRLFLLDRQEIFISVSIGVALSSTGYQQPEEILRDAEIVMARAKHRGCSSYEVFDRATHHELVAQLKLEHDLRQAVVSLENPKGKLTIDRDRSSCQFQLYYQPIISFATGEINGFEALLRWHHPTLGLVSPNDFIPIAEETGLIVTLGEWVLQEACKQLATWQKEFPGLRDLTVNINLSARQFGCSKLVDKIDEIIQETNLDSRMLKLEITESAIMENPELAAEMLWQLHQRQIKLCMDDFGTGYSCLSYLHQFPLDILKIDKSFVSKLEAEGKNFEIVRTVVTLAHNLGMEITAEGVETSAQLEILQSWGCEFGQGYLFSKPTDSETASKFLARQESDRCGVWHHLLPLSKTEFCVG